MGLGSDGNGACHWRLRSPDDDSCYAAGVTSDGGVGSDGICVDNVVPHHGSTCNLMIF